LVELLYKRNPEKFSNLSLITNDIQNIIIELNEFKNKNFSLKIGTVENVINKIGELIKGYSMKK